MSVDTDDGRRSKHGYEHARLEGVDVYVSHRLPSYTDAVHIYVKRSIFGKRLSLDLLHKPESDCPE